MLALNTVITEKRDRFPRGGKKKHLTEIVEDARKSSNLVGLLEMSPLP